MTKRFRCIVRVTVVAVGLVVPMTVAAQSGTDDDWSPPRTADGKPDLQGVWANNNATPLQRPEVLGNRQYLTDEELAAIQSRAAELFALDAGDAAFGDTVFAAALAEAESFSSTDTATGNYNQFWMVERDWDNRTSLIVDPPNGRLPATTTPAAERAEDRAMRRRRHAEWTDDRSLGERCLSFGAPAPGSRLQQLLPDLPDREPCRLAHGDGARRPDHSARRATPRRRWDPPVARRLPWSLGGGTPSWSRRRTTRPRRTSWPAGENLEITERFTLVGPDVLQYEITVSDPSTWERPWSAMIPLRRSPDALFEYACHEGNIGMEGILAGARALEEAEAVGAR